MIKERAQQIAEQWLTHAAESAGQKDLEGHMGMISKRVSLQGVPGFDNIDYDTCYKRCRHQFKSHVNTGSDQANILKTLQKGLKCLNIYAYNQLVN